MLKIARQAVEKAVRIEALPEPDLTEIPERLLEMGASFVTLTKHGNLRGCIGAIEAYQPLILDVIEHAAAGGS